MDKKVHILVFDDDKKLNALLEEYLGGLGYRVTAAPLPSAGLELMKREKPDLIILDIMLPEMSGFEVCKEIRKSASVPVIMLTARGDVMDRIVGLELGADDYLPKPFEPRELAARIQSVLRRFKTAPAKSIKMGCLEVDRETQTVRLNGLVISLTTMEFELLCLFIENPGKILSRDRIMDALRGMDWTAFDRSVDVLVGRLRQKLNDEPRNPKWIVTVRGAGYKMIGRHDEN
jgi:DNA-binding response OmpR family regulator